MWHVRHLGQQRLLDKTHQRIELQHPYVDEKRGVEIGVEIGVEKGAQTHSNVHGVVREKLQIPTVDNSHQRLQKQHSGASGNSRVENLFASLCEN